LNNIKKRATELMKPIETQIMMCDSREETLLFACVMLEKVKSLLEAHLGKAGRRQIFILRDEGNRHE
tara:strand:+ start:940 stop:1140 length:201 start_codon:yes stop_codon:yes gene_type:complete